MLILSLNHGHSLMIGPDIEIKYLGRRGNDALLEFSTSPMPLRVALAINQRVEVGPVAFLVTRGGADRGRQIGVGIDAPKDMRISRREPGAPAPPADQLQTAGV